WAGRILNLLILLLVALAAVLGGAVWTGMIEIPGLAEEKSAPEDKPPSALEVQLLESSPHTLSVPKPVGEALRMAKARKQPLAAARPPQTGVPLVLPGSPALDPARLLRIRARFAPAEVVRIGEVFVPGNGPTRTRELRSGDLVRQGEVLGVFYSIDV